MDQKILDGKALAHQHEQALKQRLEDKAGKNRKPTIVSFCNTQDPPSVKYTEMKRKKAQDIGIDFIVENYTLKTSKDEIIQKINQINLDQSIDGIMLQLPLPDELNPFQEDILKQISPQKDVDGLVETSPFLPATVKAVISLLEDYVVDWEKKSIGVVGATGEVGRPLVKYLKSKNVKVVEVSRSVGDLQTDLKEVDVVVSATGHKDLVTPDLIKDGVILIDVGLGDFDQRCYQKASFYTPIVGGVGPMTVISLMENAVQSFEQNQSS